MVLTFSLNGDEMKTDICDGGRINYALIFHSSTHTFDGSRNFITFRMCI